MDMDRKPENKPVSGAGQSAGHSVVENAFDIWLQRHLHRLYDGVMQEPLPPELLRLIEADRERRQV
jgi:hypothetical protein